MHCSHKKKEAQNGVVLNGTIAQNEFLLLDFERKPIHHSKPIVEKFEVYI
jgi:hypothetical protein